MTNSARARLRAWRFAALAASSWHPRSRACMPRLPPISGRLQPMAPVTSMWRRASQPACTASLPTARQRSFLNPKNSRCRHSRPVPGGRSMPPRLPMARSTSSNTSRVASSSRQRLIRPRIRLPTKAKKTKKEKKTQPNPLPILRGVRQSTSNRVRNISGTWAWTRPATSM